MSITAQNKIGDNVAQGVAAIVNADSPNFPFTAYGPRSTFEMGKSRCEIRSGNFTRATDQMAQRTQDGKWYYAHRRGFVSATIVSQRHALTATGPDSKHGEAVGRFRFLMDITQQKLIPSALSGYEVVDVIDQGDTYQQDDGPGGTRTDTTTIRFQVDIWIPPAQYTDT